MVMKFLCLHGYGTSAAILKNQLAAFSAQADKSYEYVFLDGEEECEIASASVGAFIKGPYFCYSSNFAPADVQRACDQVSDAIEDHGPFDGVIAFSQGGSLALTYLIQHEIQHPTKPPPFKFAILFSTIVAFSPDPSFCKDIFETLSAAERGTLESFPDSAFDTLRPAGRALTETLALTLSAAKSGNHVSMKLGEDYFAHETANDEVPRVLHPQLCPHRVRVPTVHVHGRNDEPGLIRLSNLMRGLCDPAVMRTLDHSGGHDLPRKRDEAKAAVLATEWAIEESQRQFW